MLLGCYLLGDLFMSRLLSNSFQATLRLFKVTCTAFTFSGSLPSLTLNPPFPVWLASLPPSSVTILANLLYFWFYSKACHLQCDGFTQIPMPSSFVVQIYPFLIAEFMSSLHKWNLFWWPSSLVSLSFQLLYDIFFVVWNQISASLSYMPCLLFFQGKSFIFLTQ